MSFAKMSVWVKTLIVLCTVVYSTAEEDYENKLTKLWSLSGSSNSDGSAVLNVTSASIVIQPSSYGSEDVARNSRQYKQYAFKPRAIPLRREQQSQVERNVYYAPDDKYKSEILFPGNYMPIAKEKSNENLTKDSVNSPRGGRTFHPKAIPLLRSEEYQKRSLDENSEPIIKKPEGFSEQNASRRSISYFFGDDDEAEDAEDDGEDDIDTENGTGKRRKKPKIKPDMFDELEDAVEGGDEEDVTEEVDGEDIDAEDGISKGHRKKPKIKYSKLKKYAKPLLLAYKMKFLALAPVLMAGILTLITMKGIAGFFFALFMAVVGLNKGSFT